VRKLNYTILNPIDLPEPKVFFTDCDSVVQSLFGIAKSELITKLKILSLLNNKVVIAASHVLESNLTYETLIDEKLLLQEGVFVPALRSEFREFREYVKKRRKGLRRFVIGHRPLSSKLMKKADHQLDAKSDFLTENAREVVTWEHTPTAEEFKAGLVNDLKNPTSLLNRSLNLSDEVLLRLVSKIMPVEKPSRMDIERIVASLPSRERLLILNSSNLHYFLAGSHAVKSDLVAHYDSIGFIKDKAERSFVLRKCHQLDFGHRETFDAFLDALDIPQDCIKRLTDEQILGIRRDSITRKFREKYRKTLSLVRKGENSQAKEFTQTEYLPIKTEMKQAIENEVEKEIRRDELAYQVRKGFRKASYVSAIVSVLGFVFPLPIPQTATLPMALYEVIDPFISKLWDSMGNVEFLVFATKIGEPRRVPWRM